jgi:hypothetical protein
VRSFRGAECDTDHYILCDFRERLSISKRAAQKFDAERFTPRKLNELEIRKQYQIEISNSFAVLKNFNDSEDEIRASENINENTKPQLQRV